MCGRGDLTSVLSLTALCPTISPFFTYLFSLPISYQCGGYGRGKLMGGRFRGRVFLHDTDGTVF